MHNRKGTRSLCNNSPRSRLDHTLNCRTVHCHHRYRYLHLDRLLYRSSGKFQRCNYCLRSSLLWHHIVVRYFDKEAQGRYMLIAQRWSLQTTRTVLASKRDFLVSNDTLISVEMCIF